MNIFYGRAGIDQEKFIFENIEDALRKKTGRIIYLVPEQSTLQAERSAFEHIDAEGFIDLEIMSLSKLSSHILASERGAQGIPISKTGRRMLLSKILRNERDSLGIFKDVSAKPSFTDRLTDIITDMKQYGVDPDMLSEASYKISAGSLLSSKLADIERVYRLYEEEIRGRFADPEDISRLVASEAEKSDYISDSVIWIGGFDYFTPGNLELIKALDAGCRDMNIVMTGIKNRYEDDGGAFSLYFDMTDKLGDIASGNGGKLTCTEIPETYRAERPGPVMHLEREFFSFSPRPGDHGDSIELVRSSSFNSEAETVSARIMKLVQEDGLRYKDIFVICNDIDQRGSDIKRMLEDCGIPVFLDRKKDASHNSSIEFILSLLESVKNGMRFGDVFAMIKTGYTDADTDTIDILENYCIKYKIRGRRWGMPFKYGASQYGDEVMEKLEREREKINSFVMSAKKSIGGDKTVREKTAALYDFLEKKAHLPEKLEVRRRELEEKGFTDQAQETAQLWEAVVELFDQMVILAGDEKIDEGEFTEMLMSGIKAFETGLLPQSDDSVMIGTLMRSRPGRVKALFVPGVNEDVLPSGADSSSLISDEEQKKMLAECGLEIGKSGSVKRREENFAIYKALSKAEKFLWIGYESSDRDGASIQPSETVGRIKAIFPELKEKTDIISSGSREDMTRAVYPAAVHMSKAIRDHADGKEIDEDFWPAVYKYLREKGYVSENAAKPETLLNREGRLGKEKMESLFSGRRDGTEAVAEEGGELTLSPSAFETYSLCPFSFFITHGLRPHVPEPFEVNSREYGEIYHDCLRMISEELTEKDVPINDGSSKWMTITEDECAEKIASYVDQIGLTYSEGLLKAGACEEYRSSRIKKSAARGAWAMISQVRKGLIREIGFEIPFGRGKRLPQAEIDNRHGGKINIRGKIDRAEIICTPAGADDESDEKVYAKVTDYKTGNISFDRSDIEEAKSVQLMLYLKSVMKGREEKTGEKVHPGGMFYFPLKSISESVDKCTLKDALETAERERQQHFKLEGIMADDPELIECIAGDFSEKSEIIEARKNKDGSAKGKALISEEEFLKLIEQFDESASRLASDITEGKINADPRKKKGGNLPCEYCGFKSICTHE